MGGNSRTNIDNFYSGELSGVIASQWGEDVMVTMDDKLHMTDASNVQTIQGPLNFSTTGQHTWAGQMNFINTGISTWAGPLNMTTGGTHTWAGPMDLNNTLNVEGAVTYQTHVYYGNGTTYFVDQVGSPTFNQMVVANEVTFSGAIDANSTANFQGIVTCQTGASFGNTVTFSGQINGSTLTMSSTATFAAIDLVNTVTEFSTDTTLGDNSDTVVPTERAVKTYTDLRAFWEADNAAVTRSISIDPYDVIAKAVDNSTPPAHRWSEEAGNGRAGNITTGNTVMGVMFPDGVVVTALRVYGQCNGTLITSLNRRTGEQTAPSSTEMAAVTMTSSFGEVSDVSISVATIDNTTYSYFLKFDHTYSLNPARVHKIQIDYTVVRPQP